MDRRQRQSHRPAAGARAGASLAALAVLVIVALFNNIDRALLAVLQVPVRRDLGLSDAQLGATTGLSFAFVYATAALPMGRLIDRFRRTWVLAAALTLWTLLTAASGLVTTFVALVVCRMGVALGEACAVPASYSLLSDYFPPRRRGTVFGIWAVAAPCGILLGLLAAGFLTSEWGWRRSFIYVGLAGLLIVPLLLLLPEPRRGQQEDGFAAAAVPRPPPLREALAVFLTRPAFRALLLGATAQTFAFAAFINWTAPFYARAHGLSMAEVGLWSALTIGLGGLVGNLASGVSVDLLARHNGAWYAWGPAMACAGFFLAGLGQFLVPSTTASIALGFICGALGGFYVAPMHAAGQSLVSPSMRGVTAAVLMFVPTIFGTGLGPFLTGALSDALSARLGPGVGLRWAIVAALIPALAAAAILGRSGRELGGELDRAADR